MATLPFILFPMLHISRRHLFIVVFQQYALCFSTCLPKYETRFAQVCIRALVWFPSSRHSCRVFMCLLWPQKIARVLLGLNIDWSTNLGLPNIPLSCRNGSVGFIQVSNPQVTRTKIRKSNPEGTTVAGQKVSPSSLRPKMC